MWSFPISNGVDNSSEDGSGGSDGKVAAVAQEVEPSACEIQCKIEQKELVSCVDSIRAAKASSSNTTADNSEASTSSSGDTDEESSAETPACLPLAIAAWTKCCTEANDLQLEQQQQQKEELKKEDAP